MKPHWAIALTLMPISFVAYAEPAAETTCAGKVIDDKGASAKKTYAILEAQASWSETWTVLSPIDTAPFSLDCGR